MRNFLNKLRERLGTLWWYAALSFVASRIGDVVNIFIGLWLVPKFVSQEDLGAVLPLLSIASVFMLPINIAMIPVPKFINVFYVKNEWGKLKSLMLDAFAVIGVLSIFTIGWLFRSGDAILLRMHMTDRHLLFPMAIAAIVACLSPVIDASMKSLKKFNGLILINFTGPYVRLALMLLLLPAFGALGYLWAQLGCTIWSFVFSAAIVLFFLSRLPRRESYRSNLREIWRYSLPLLVIALAARIQAPIEMFVIRHRLSAADSAGYYYANMFGLMATAFTSAIVPFFGPLVSERHEVGRSTRSLLLQAMCFTFSMGIAAVILLAIFAPMIFRFPGPWSPGAPYAKFIWQVGLIGVLNATQVVFFSHEENCRRFNYVRYFVPIVLLESAVIYSLPGWNAFHGRIPEILWQWVDVHWETSLQNILRIIIGKFALINLCAVIDCALQLRRETKQANRKHIA